MWDANTSRADAYIDNVEYTGGPHISRRITRTNTNFESYWRCERRRCAPVVIPVEDNLVGVVWEYTDSPDHFRYMRSLGQREYLSEARNYCARPGYVAVPT
jgi:hypothetical protein